MRARIPWVLGIVSIAIPAAAQAPPQAETPQAETPTEAAPTEAPAPTPSPPTPPAQPPVAAHRAGGKLELSSSAPGLQFLLDDKPVGEGHVLLVNPKPGRRTVTLGWTTRAPVKLPIDVGGGDLVQVIIQADGRSSVRTERTSGGQTLWSLSPATVQTTEAGCHDKSTCLEITTEDVRAAHGFASGLPLRIKNTCAEPIAVSHCFARALGVAACGGMLVPSKGEAVDAIFGSCGPGRVSATSVADAASCRAMTKEVACAQ